jgi:hypothetical protein
VSSADAAIDRTGDVVPVSSQTGAVVGYEVAQAGARAS